MIIGQSKVATWHNVVALDGWKKKHLFEKIFQKIQMMACVTF